MSNTFIPFPTLRRPLRSLLLLLLPFQLLLGSCKDKATEDSAAANDTQEVLTPVTITTGAQATIKDSVTFNAVSAYQLSTDIKANINGYINSVRLHLGEKISKGQTLFVLQTKESKSLGSTITQLDSSFKFSGITTVKSSTTGYISMLNHQSGDYVQDGEILASIASDNSFGFMLNLPFEYRQLVQLGQTVQITLPDNTVRLGAVRQIMPQMDSLSQTQQVFIKTSSANVPSGLIAKVVLVKKAISGFTLPKDCVYADDSQQNFWVMQLLNDSTAVKVPIQKSLENSSSIAIESPKFSPTDRFVLQGGYGLSDTAKISIQK